MSQTAGAKSLPRDSYYVIGKTEEGFPIYMATGPIGWTGPRGPNDPAGSELQHTIPNSGAVVIKPAPPVCEN